MTSTRDRTGQSLPRDHRSDNTGSGSAADSDTGIDDFAWDEKTIFTEPTRVSSPIPLAARALSAECNVDDFAQSIRDTKEWSFMQYHPAMLEPGNSHLNMLDKYKSALESWKHSQYQYNKKGHNSKRYKGRNDAGRYHNKSYDPNGYSNKPRGNGRFHNKLPDYEQVSGPWGEAPQHISGLPEPSRHNASSENFGPRYTQYAAGRFVAGQANGDDRWLGHKRPEFEREFRHSPDAHRKRGWTELQNDAGGFRTKTHHSEAYYEYQERSSKRSKYLSPEPGEIAEDSDHPYDGRSDSFTPSRQEPFEEEHRGIVDRGRHDYAKHNSEKSRDAFGGNRDKNDSERDTTPPVPVNDLASASEPGEVVEIDLPSHQRHGLHKIWDRADTTIRPYHSSGKPPQVDETSDRHPKKPLYHYDHQHIDGSPDDRVVKNWDGNNNNSNNNISEPPPLPDRAPPPLHSRPSSRRSSRGHWGGSQRDRDRDRDMDKESEPNSRRSSLGGGDSPLTPTELALLGLDRPSTSGSDTAEGGGGEEEESPKRQFEDVTPKFKSRRPRVHEAYR